MDVDGVNSSTFRLKTHKITLTHWPQGNLNEILDL